MSRKLTLLKLPQINREKLLGLLIVSHQLLVSSTNILITVIIQQDISFFLLDNELGFLYRISHIIECLPRTSYVFYFKTCLDWLDFNIMEQAGQGVNIPTDGMEEDLSSKK